MLLPGSGHHANWAGSQRTHSNPDPNPDEYAGVGDLYPHPDPYSLPASDLFGHTYPDHYPDANRDVHAVCAADTHAHTNRNLHRHPTGTEQHANPDGNPGIYPAWAAMKIEIVNKRVRKPL